MHGVGAHTGAETIVDHCMPKGAKTPTCGKLLAYCKDKVTAFREIQGIRVCIFKIGVTADPVSRFQLYFKQGFTSMWLIATSDSVDLVHMLEAALISEFSKHVGCRNLAGTGGGGAETENHLLSPHTMSILLVEGQTNHDGLDECFHVRPRGQKKRC